MNALAAHLADHDAPCPGCGYNLRGCAEAICPECGQKLVLQVGAGEAAHHLLALRYLFLGLIIWNGAGRVPIAVLEMLRDWQSSSNTLPAGEWHFWYVVAELFHAVLVLVLAILGLRSSRIASGRGGRGATSRDYAFTILWLQVLATISHVIILMLI